MVTFYQVFAISVAVLCMIIVFNAPHPVTQS